MVDEGIWGYDHAVTRGADGGCRHWADTDECQSFVKTHWKSASSFCRSKGNKKKAHFESEMKTVTTSEKEMVGDFGYQIPFIH